MLKDLSAPPSPSPTLADPRLSLTGAVLSPHFAFRGSARLCNFLNVDASQLGRVWPQPALTSR